MKSGLQENGYQSIVMLGNYSWLRKTWFGLNGMTQATQEEDLFFGLLW